ncbi:hypothetical protein Tcan_02772 [Toxocara canis]|uniref:Uncharacterized protein n=1 Tax=Toxocara canis TaxID=6265 RepID=A0A0B2VQA6_TOXCA|nr:hypothetical protein Tcan_02772 [Toxocara canis]
MASCGESPIVFLLLLVTLITCAASDVPAGGWGGSSGSGWSSSPAGSFGGSSGSGWGSNLGKDYNPENQQKSKSRRMGGFTGFISDE